MAYSLEEIIANEQAFPNDVKVLDAGGQAVTLGDFRSSFRSKDADYRQKTTRLAEEKRNFESLQASHQAAYMEAEAKLVEWTKQLMQANPETTQDQVESQLEDDPRYKKLSDKLAKLEGALTEQSTRYQKLEQAQVDEQKRRWTMAHEQALAKISQEDERFKDPEVVRDLVNFARERGIPRLDDAHQVKYAQEIREREIKKALDAELPKAVEKKMAEQPVLRNTRLVKPPADAPKTMDEAFARAITDSEIMGPLMGTLPQL